MLVGIVLTADVFSDGLRCINHYFTIFVLYRCEMDDSNSIMIKDESAEQRMHCVRC